MTYWTNQTPTVPTNHQPRHARAGRVAMTCLLLAGIGLVASGCTGFRKAIGEEKSSPDEFEVVVRPPLSLPPNFFASASQLTENAPTSSTTDSPIDARSVAAATLGSIEGQAEETYGIQFEKRIPLQMLFGGLPDVGPVLDKFAEDQRLRRLLREGQSPTEGGTPAVDLLDDEPVTIGN